MIILGIETSCDETACGLVDENLNLRANAVFSQEDRHAIFGGVVPEIAARAHLEKITLVMEKALAQSGLSLGAIGLIAFTRGPGLVGSLLVGASFAQGLGKSLDIPVVGINHLEGHLGAVYLTHKSVSTPFVCLTVSGGHTELCLVKEHCRYRVMGRTRDDAAGEAFDKCGKMLDLGYPAGPAISRLASEGDRHFIDLPMGLNKKDNLDFSFSGLKTAFLRYVKSQPQVLLGQHRADICASLENAIVKSLIKKTLRAMQQAGVRRAAVCGGVSANRHLRESFLQYGQKLGYDFLFPDFSLCTDNGAMIAAIAQIQQNNKALSSEIEVTPFLSWPA
jgi:N6-L-threonylcarbamoyladenine synthase